jgi:hypothetical protein
MAAMRMFFSVSPFYTVSTRTFSRFPRFLPLPTFEYDKTCVCLLTCVSLCSHTLIPPRGYNICGVTGSCGPWLDGFSVIITK